MEEIRISEEGVMLRPRRIDPCVRRRASEMALPDVKRWLGYVEDSDEELIRCLMKHIDGGNGYEIVKSLEHDGWSNADGGLVDVMDSDFIDLALRELTEQWVCCLGIRLVLELGANVCYRGQAARIVKLMEDVAQYGVRTPDIEGTAYYVCDAEMFHPVSHLESVA
jgi:hypothetical protein